MHLNLKSNYVIFIVIILVLVSGCTKTPLTSSEVAKCLTSSGAKMYGTSTCSDCDDQKAHFGGDFKYITYIECDTAGAEECAKAGITTYPTWVFGDGRKLIGVQYLEELSAMANCEIKNPYKIKTEEQNKPTNEDSAPSSNIPQTKPSTSKPKLGTYHGALTLNVDERHTFDSPYAVKGATGLNQHLTVTVLYSNMSNDRYYHDKPEIFSSAKFDYSCDLTGDYTGNLPGTASHSGEFDYGSYDVSFILDNDGNRAGLTPRFGGPWNQVTYQAECYMASGPPEMMSDVISDIFGISPENPETRLQYGDKAHYAMDPNGETINLKRQFVKEDKTYDYSGSLTLIKD